MIKFSYSLVWFTIVFATHVAAQQKTNGNLEKILTANTDSVFQQVINNPLKYRCQIIYTQIDRDRHNKPSFTNHYFNFDPELYFNPASTVKMPLAFLSLQKIKRLSNKGINKFTPVQFDSSYPGQRRAYTDSSSPDYLPSIGHYIKKAFLVSDNDAYNRMYQFLGQQYIKSHLFDRGYPQTKIVRQFMGFTTDQNRHTNQMRFINGAGDNIYTQPAAYNTDTFELNKIIRIGNAHYNRNDSLVNQPFDFTGHNNVSLYDLQQMLQSLLFPKSVPASKRFDIAQADRQFLLQYLSQFPGETNFPRYDTTEYFDSFVKFFFRDSSRKLPGNIRVFNKVGWAYGFMTDVSYIVDFTNKAEFMLAATIYVNSDGILNDDKYDYETISYPFFYQLGQSIYKYELARKRLYPPDLSGFRLSYEERKADNTRPLIKGVDN